MNNYFGLYLKFLGGGPTFQKMSQEKVPGVSMKNHAPSFNLRS